MKLFLTSNIGAYYKENGIRIPCALDNSNGFVDHLKKYWTKHPRCLLIASDPKSFDFTDTIKEAFFKAFSLTGLELLTLDVCDARYDKHLQTAINAYEVIILCGGHVPTQNDYINEINLKAHLQNYEGIIIGISAGSMNAADLVYAQPEHEGEAIDPSFSRYLSGLGLTEISILPHYQDLHGQRLDNLLIIEDISLPDSHKRPFYAINDGTYFFIDDMSTTLYGEAYLFDKGLILKVCDNNQTLKL